MKKSLILLFPLTVFALVGCATESTRVASADCKSAKSYAGQSAQVAALEQIEARADMVSVPYYRYQRMSQLDGADAQPGGKCR